MTDINDAHRVHLMMSDYDPRCPKCNPRGVTV